MIAPPKFTAEDADRAYETWGCNCGPSAIAAIMGLTLDEVRPLMGDFEAKRYTNPTLMWATLGRIGRPWRKLRSPLDWPAYGLVRIQWHGPWMGEGVPMAARYRHTHWVGAGRRSGEIGVWDVNAMGNGSGWCRLEHWAGKLVPYILEHAVPRSDGKWSMTHVVEVGS